MKSKEAAQKAEIKKHDEEKEKVIHLESIKTPGQTARGTKGSLYSSKAILARKKARKLQRHCRRVNRC